MQTQKLKQKLNHYIDAAFPIIYIHTFDEIKADGIIAQVAKSADRRVMEWDGSRALTEWNHKNDRLIKCPCSSQDDSMEVVLNSMKEDEGLLGKILVIKDGHHFFDNPRIISVLKDISHKILSGLRATILIVSSIVSIPQELEKHITIFEIGHIDDAEIKEVILRFMDVREVEVSINLLERMIRSFKGLSEYEIKNILALAYAKDGRFVEEDLKLIFEQKQQVIKKSGILEMVQLKESLDDIGGLDNLKSWLEKKSAIFNNLNTAIKFGVDIPKGVLIVGVPGCGKSLNAKAVAHLFDVPLLRLDMGRVLGKYVGESEANMKKAILLAEAISPCVLWIDEIEKAFAGIGESGGGAEVTTRLFGNFLTWMQEKNSASFVVATANDILKLPPELTRKGRFDEIFYVGLPSDEERKKIFQIHIEKRRKSDLSRIDINELVKRTKGYSGADIEGVVKDSIETVFVARKQELTTSDLLETIESTHSISETMKDSLEKISKEYEKQRFKNASF